MAAVKHILTKNRAALEKQSLTKKHVRRLTETHLGLEKKALDEKKSIVNLAIEDFIQKLNNDESEEEEEEADFKASRKRSNSSRDESEAKRAKRAPAKSKQPADGKPRMIQPKPLEGRVAPKKIKQMQENLMSGEEFLDNAEDIELDIHGNLVTLCARNFTSGNKG